MKLVTAAQMREMDRRASAEFGVSGETLMEHAGEAVAEEVQHLSRTAGPDDPAVLLVAGRGNNGGDAFAAARILREREFDVEVWTAGETRAAGGDALRHLGRMKAAGVTPRELPTREAWDDALRAPLAFDIVVDGVLGTGLSGPARGPAAGAIQYINALGDRGLVVAVDVPSGLNSDTGEASGDAVVADVTVTLGLPKRGLVQSCAVEYVGNVEVADIGIPPELLASIESDAELITPQDLRPALRRRRRADHKGAFGHVLVIGGAAGYAGAAGLACRAALRSGAGLVSALVPAPVAAVVAAMAPEAMVHAGVATDSGTLAGDAAAAWGRNLAEFDAVLVGPGLGRGPGVLELLQHVLRTGRGPVVVDADALNACSGRFEALTDTGRQMVLTPHPGEAGRLLGLSAAEVQADRSGAARRIAERTRAVTVLKGAGTLVASSGRPLHHNLTGNPGMASGGMGDVLAGMIAGLIAQGIEAFDAACIGVWLHGRAGDGVARRTCQAAMTAGDVVEELPHAFRDLVSR